MSDQNDNTQQDNGPTLPDLGKRIELAVYAGSGKDLDDFDDVEAALSDPDVRRGKEPWIDGLLKEYQDGQAAAAEEAKQRQEEEAKKDADALVEKYVQELRQEDEERERKAEEERLKEFARTKLQLERVAAAGGSATSSATDILAEAEARIATATSRDERDALAAEAISKLEKIKVQRVESKLESPDTVLARLKEQRQ
jgi:hypothetical protein